jgi:hypothetical protein
VASIVSGTPFGVGIAAGADRADVLRVYGPIPAKVVDARFIDPFNDVAGHAGIRRVFEHMFATLDEPRFEVVQALHRGRRVRCPVELPVSAQGPFGAHADPRGQPPAFCSRWPRGLAS